MLKNKFRKLRFTLYLKHAGKERKRQEKRSVFCQTRAEILKKIKPTVIKKVSFMEKDSLKVLISYSIVVNKN